jgi:hypothetical protein
MTQQLSNCCKAQVTVSSGDEGTSCFMCSECKRPCDLFCDKSLMLAQELPSTEATKENLWVLFPQVDYMILSHKEFNRLKEIESMYEGLCK